METMDTGGWGLICARDQWVREMRHRLDMRDRTRTSPGVESAMKRKKIAKGVRRTVMTVLFPVTKTVFP
ncbi:hypothetical protein [Acetobacter oeni]|uniref:Uncharacterized protein n=1 Tax=Acetobacter oeni TaxID=304077 RepID=A0A511XKV0_9PROT|nr:hypothetical protein [Acetobacter oeni]MBB3883806.1 hypothetical protein [Acetobacter oeni]NHO19851.1 hypothetical protein [Acetobacter oeni]GBR10463.1 hypothetical protein AA21952_3082 [Acetobacter oeni LMG 21952]GEN63560.1 hypothetical protein AOE01nite_17840 [Acetobacter oeni]